MSATELKRPSIPNRAIILSTAPWLAGAILGGMWQGAEHGARMGATVAALMGAPVLVVAALMLILRRSDSESSALRFAVNRDDERDRSIMTRSLAHAGVAAYIIACFTGVWAATGALRVEAFVLVVAIAFPAALAVAYSIHTRRSR